jgi:hypothetical protein
MIGRILLTLLIGPTIPVPPPAAITEALTSAQVTVSAGQRSGFQLTFQIGPRSPISNIAIPAGLFDPGIRVILMATVNGMPTVLSDGFIIRQEVAPSNTPGQSTLTVTGEDVSVRMALAEVRGRPFPALSDELRIGAILAQYALLGVIPVIIPSLFQEINNPLEQIDFQQGTDLDYIEQLAKKNGYVFYVEPGPAPGVNIAYFGPQIRIGIPQPALSIGMDAASNVEQLSFTLDGSSRSQLAIAVQEPFSKLTIPIPLPEISPLSPPLGIRPAPALRSRFVEGAARLNPMRAILKGVGEAVEQADAITATGSLDVLRYGRLLKARQLVGVRGAGVAYDGLWFVKSVTSTIDARKRSYNQSFQLARGGLISIVPRVPV